MLATVGHGGGTTFPVTDRERMSPVGKRGNTRSDPLGKVTGKWSKVPSIIWIESVWGSASVSADRPPPCPLSSLRDWLGCCCTEVNDGIGNDGEDVVVWAREPRQDWISSLPWSESMIAFKRFVVNVYTWLVSEATRRSTSAPVSSANSKAFFMRPVLRFEKVEQRRTRSCIKEIGIFCLPRVSLRRFKGISPLVGDACGWEEKD